MQYAARRRTVLGRGLSWLFRVPDGDPVNVDAVEAARWALFAASWALTVWPYNALTPTTPPMAVYLGQATVVAFAAGYLLELVARLFPGGRKGRYRTAAFAAGLAIGAAWLVAIPRQAVDPAGVAVARERAADDLTTKVRFTAAMADGKLTGFESDTIRNDYLLRHDGNDVRRASWVDDATHRFANVGAVVPLVAALLLAMLAVAMRRLSR